MYQESARSNSEGPTSSATCSRHASSAPVSASTRVRPLRSRSSIIRTISSPWISAQVGPLQNPDGLCGP